MAGMSDKRKSGAALPLFTAASLLLLGLAVAYVAGYYGLGRRIGDGKHWRTFRAHWLVTIYRPAAYVESAATGEEIKVGYWDWP
jgi:hypothetical protein